MSAGSIFKRISIFLLVLSIGIFFLYLINGVWLMTVLIVLGIATGVSGIIRCYSCHRKIGVFGIFSRTCDMEFIQTNGYNPPDGMSVYDELCKSCLNNITKTQVQKKLPENSKYSKELSVFQNVFGVWNLGWRYGTYSFLTSCIMLCGMVSFAMFLTEYGNDSSGPYFMPVSAMIVVLLIFPFYCVINWHFIKKYNYRIREIQNSNISHS